MDKVILVQPAKQDGEESDSEGESTLEPVNDENKKGDDKVKIFLTGPSMQLEDDDILEGIKADHEESSILASESHTGDKPKGVRDALESAGEKESETKHIEESQKEMEKQVLDGTGDVPVKEHGHVPVPDSNVETEISPKEDDTKNTAAGEDSTLSKVDKPDEAVPPKPSNDDQNAKEPSSEMDVVVNESQPTQSQEHHPDPTVMTSHPLKPLPNIDEGIMETKSEPRLPLLPPIGSKKLTSLQSNGDPLRSQSATGLSSSTTVKQLALKGPTGREREGAESGVFPLSDQAPVKKRKSVDTLRSTSGSSISKSKKSSSSSSAVSLGRKSKSKESLKYGPQSRLAATSRSTDNLVDGATKKLSISRESLKAANQVYSTAPRTKSGESCRKGESGKMTFSKSSKGKERKSGEQKDKEMKNSEGKHKEDKCHSSEPVAKNETAADASGTTKEAAIEVNSCKDTKDKEKTEDKFAAPESEPDTNMEEKVTPQTPSVEEQPVRSNDSLAEKGNADNATADSNKGNEGRAVSPGEDATQFSSIGDKNTESNGRNTGDVSVAKDEKSEGQTEQVTPDSKEKDQESTHNEAQPQKAAADGSTEKKACTSAPSSADQERFEMAAKTKENEQTGQQGEPPPKPKLANEMHPKDFKDPSTVPAALAGPGEDTLSQTSASDGISKLEIDKKTGQSEQSIVEAVEKSSELTSTTANVLTTSA